MIKYFEGLFTNEGLHLIPHLDTEFGQTGRKIIGQRDSS